MKKSWGIGQAFRSRRRASGRTTLPRSQACSLGARSGFRFPMKCPPDISPSRKNKKTPKGLFAILWRRGSRSQITFCRRKKFSRPRLAAPPVRRNAAPFDPPTKSTQVLFPSPPKNKSARKGANVLTCGDGGNRTPVQRGEAAGFYEV
jgi:hypothetical protein